MRRRDGGRGVGAHRRRAGGAVRLVAPLRGRDVLARPALRVFPGPGLRRLAALGSIYGEGYWTESRHPENGRRLRFFYGLATASLVLVMAAGDAWSFLVGVGDLALAAFFLITTDETDAAALRAGWIYLASAHAATLILFAMFALLRDATAGLAPCSLRGTRVVRPAGADPRPRARRLRTQGGRDAAPHLAAGRARRRAEPRLGRPVGRRPEDGHLRAPAGALSMLPAYPAWLGLALVGLGIASGVLGVVLALAQHDLKRLLAYHSIENIGIILIGLGVGVLGDGAGPAGLGGARIRGRAPARLEPRRCSRRFSSTRPAP